VVIHSSGTTGEAGGELVRNRTTSLGLGERGGESITVLGGVAVYSLLGDRNVDSGLDREEELLIELCLGG
jgi:hypothetical protein